MTSKLLKDYKLAGPMIRRIYDSSLRVAILDALKDGPMRLADLRRKVDANAPNTSSKAKELEEMGMVERSNGDYRLSPYGQAVRTRIQDSLEFYTTYEKFKEFWEARDTSAIPEHIWLRLGELRNSELIKAELPEVMRTHNECLKILKSPKERFFGITAAFRSEYLEMALSLLKANLHAEFIISNKVLERVAEVATPKIVNLFDNYECQVLFRNDNIPLTLKVTETWFFLTLESKSSGLDMMAMDLQSTDLRAVRWGMDLFEYYKSKSKPVKLSDYL